MLKVCLTCGNEFHVRKAYENYLLRRGQRPPSFCSIQCHSASRRRNLTEDYIIGNSIPEPNSGCWLWCGSYFSNGYGRIGRNGAHVISWQLYAKENTKGRIVRHKCDNKACVNPDHIEIGTTQDNRDDCVSRGRQAKGSRISRAVLTEDLVIRLKERFKRPVNIAKLSLETGIPKQALYHLKAGRSWKHVIV